MILLQTGDEFFPVESSRLVSAKAVPLAFLQPVLPLRNGMNDGCISDSGMMKSPYPTTKVFLPAQSPPPRWFRPAPLVALLAKSLRP